MASNNKYVIFDWDNTVRNGYTLYSWVDFLCNNSIINPDFKYELNQIKEQYYQNHFTHDEYAKKACSLYAKSLMGLSFESVNNVVLDYMDYDRECLFKGIVPLFELFYDMNIDVIILSGAPSIILENYRTEFHLKSIFAFKEQVLHGVFTGDVECNHGFDKKSKVLELEKKYNSFPYMAFGDSESDVPMLECADHAFYITSTMSASKYKSINPNKISNGLINEIEQLLCL